MKSKNTNKKNSVKSKVSATANKSSSEFVFPDNHLIPKTTGSEMILNLNAAISSKAMPFEIPIAINFNRNIFDLILKEENCKGIRLYYGLNELNQLSLIIAGIDVNMNDIYVPIILEGEKGSKIMGIGDMGQACPLYSKETIQLP